MLDILKVVFVIIGTMIGAGFASGQEIYLFFFSHGKAGIVGILISCLVIGVVIYKILVLVNKYKIDNYKMFLNICIKNNIKIKSIINKTINMFILVTFFIMISGFGAYCKQEIGINKIVGSSILAISVFSVFMTNIKGVIKANGVITPLLVFLIAIIGVFSLKGNDFIGLGNHIVKKNNSNFILSAILYSSYNSILLTPVLLTLKEYVKNKKQIFKITIISTIILISLSIIIFLILTKIDIIDISKLEMPAVYAVSTIYIGLKYIYGLVIMGSIFTTTVSLGNSFLQNIAKNKKSYTQIAAIMCITSIIISNIGFSNLVRLLYPIFGYLGFIQIIKLMYI